MVNAALAEEMKDIHALSITKALTPEQQLKKQQEAEKSQVAAWKYLYTIMTTLHKVWGQNILDCNK